MGLEPKERWVFVSDFWNPAWRDEYTVAFREINETEPGGCCCCGETIALGDPIWVTTVEIARGDASDGNEVCYCETCASTDIDEQRDDGVVGGPYVPRHEVPVRLRIRELLIDWPVVADRWPHLARVAT